MSKKLILLLFVATSMCNATMQNPAQYRDSDPEWNTEWHNAESDSDSDSALDPYDIKDGPPPLVAPVPPLATRIPALVQVVAHAPGLPPLVKVIAPAHWVLLNQG